MTLLLFLILLAILYSTEKGRELLSGFLELIRKLFLLPFKIISYPFKLIKENQEELIKNEEFKKIDAFKENLGVSDLELVEDPNSIYSDDYNPEESVIYPENFQNILEQIALYKKFKKGEIHKTYLEPDMLMIAQGNNSLNFIRPEKIDELREKLKTKNNMKTKGKILLVDDDEVLRDMYKTKFGQVGFLVDALENANGDFVEKVFNIKPDLIFLDIVMPGRFGYEAIELLKADERTKDIPVIFVSNMSLRENITKGIQLGAVDYLITVFLTPSDWIKTALDYFNNPSEYIKRYPIFLEAETTNFQGKNDDEKSEKHDKFIKQKMREGGIDWSD